MLGGADVSFTIEQQIPLSGIRGHRRASALADVDRLRADASRTTLDVGIQAANAFLTRHNCTSHEAYIRQAAWLGLDASAKQGVTIALAVACGTIGQASASSMTVFDSESGKQLAPCRRLRLQR